MLSSSSTLDGEVVDDVFLKELQPLKEMKIKSLQRNRLGTRVWAMAEDGLHVYDTSDGMRLMAHDGQKELRRAVCVAPLLDDFVVLVRNAEERCELCVFDRTDGETRRHRKFAKSVVDVVVDGVFCAVVMTDEIVILRFVEEKREFEDPRKSFQRGMPKAHDFELCAFSDKAMMLLFKPSQFRLCCAFVGFDGGFSFVESEVGPFDTEPVFLRVSATGKKLAVCLDEGRQVCVMNVSPETKKVSPEKRFLWRGRSSCELYDINFGADDRIMGLLGTSDTWHFYDLASEHTNSFLKISKNPFNGKCVFWFSPVSTTNKMQIMFAEQGDNYVRYRMELKEEMTAEAKTKKDLSFQRSFLQLKKDGVGMSNVFEHRIVRHVSGKNLLSFATKHGMAYMRFDETGAQTMIHSCKIGPMQRVEQYQESNLFFLVPSAGNELFPSPKTVYIWDDKQQKAVLGLPFTKGIMDLSVGSKYFVVLTEESHLYVYNFPAAQCVRHIVIAKTAMAFTRKDVLFYFVETKDENKCVMKRVDLANGTEESCEMEFGVPDKIAASAEGTRTFLLCNGATGKFKALEGFREIYGRDPANEKVPKKATIQHIAISPKGTFGVFVTPEAVSLMNLDEVQKRGKVNIREEETHIHFPEDESRVYIFTTRRQFYRLPTPR